MSAKAGLEPARISTVDFESTASTDFATSALKGRGCGNVVDYTCRAPPCKRRRAKPALSAQKTSALRHSSSVTASRITPAAFCSGSASTLAHISCTISQESFSLPAAFSGICSSWMSSPY